ncbi:MAG: tetratricopeptide repeat protein [Nitrospinota bacterium]
MKAAKFSIIFLLLTILAVPVQAEEFKALLKQGDEHYAKFENDKALANYEKAYAVNPCSYEALMKVTRAYIDRGEDLDNKESEGLYIQAVDHAELMIKKAPDKAEPYFYAAAAYGKLALFRGGKEKVKLSGFVEKNAKKAIELDPQYEKPVTTLGIYYREVANLNWFLKAFANTFFGGKLKGTNEDAERLLLKAIKLDPNRIYPRFALAKTYKIMRKKDKEIEQLKKVLELPIGDHEDQKKKDDARKRLEKLTKK